MEQEIKWKKIDYTNIPKNKKVVAINNNGDVKAGYMDITVANNDITLWVGGDAYANNPFTHYIELNTLLTLSKEQ